MAVFVERVEQWCFGRVSGMGGGGTGCSSLHDRHLRQKFKGVLISSTQGWGPAIRLRTHCNNTTHVSPLFHMSTPCPT